MANNDHKGCVIINIQGLNKITELNSYSLSLQSKIIDAVAGFSYISTVNVFD